MARYVVLTISSSSFHKLSGYEKVTGVGTWVCKAGERHFLPGKSWMISSEVDELTQFPCHQIQQTKPKALTWGASQQAGRNPGLEFDSVSAIMLVCVPLELRRRSRGACSR
jgi:hypothetical protein